MEIIDLFKIAETNRPKRVLSAYRELAGGQSVEIRSDVPPESVLKALQSGHWGEFDWTPLEESVASHRYRLTKRSRPAAVPRSLTEYHREDQSALDGLLIQVAERVREGDWPRADRTFSNFMTAFSRHVRMEEEIALPLYVKARGVGEGDLMWIQSDHRKTIPKISQLGSTIQRNADAPGEKSVAEHVGNEIAALLDDLRSHTDREDADLYPACDQFLSPDERDEIIKQMQRIYPILRLRSGPIQSPNNC